MLLDNPSASVWLITPGLNLMSRIFLCKHKAHQINLELCGDIDINHFRQVWSVIIFTGTPNMYRSKFLKASRTARHSFSTVEKRVSRGNNFFTKYAIGCSVSNWFCWVSTVPQQNWEQSSFKANGTLKFGGCKTGKHINSFRRSSNGNTVHLKFIRLICFVSSGRGKARSL